MRFVRLALPVVCLIVFGLVLAVARRQHDALTPEGDRAPVTALLLHHSAFDEPNPPGRYYPYSLCDGGARTPAEFLAKLDPLARGHFQRVGFDLSQLRVVYAEGDLDRQVSARLVNRIVRTRRILHIQKGERLFTDGVHYARARCCNAMFEPGAKAPVPFAAPVEEAAVVPALDVPFVLAPPEVSLVSFGSPEAVEAAHSPESRAAVPSGAQPAGPGQASGFAPRELPSGGVGWVGAGPGALPLTARVAQGIAASAPTAPAAMIAPTAAPEPGTLSLLSLALGGGMVLCRIRRSGYRAD